MTGDWLGGLGFAVGALIMAIMLLGPIYFGWFDAYMPLGCPVP